MLDEGADDESAYFAYSATLRIHGSSLPFAAITDTLGVAPTHQRRRGETRSAGGRRYRDDAWHLTAATNEGCELTEHLRELWRIVEPHVEYLLALDATVDVFCGYRSNNGLSGFAVEPDALRIFSALNIPFGVSVIITNEFAEGSDGLTLQ